MGQKSTIKQFAKRLVKSTLYYFTSSDNFVVIEHFTRTIKTNFPQRVITFLDSNNFVATK